MQMPDAKTPLKIGTRGSPLALAQAHETRARLMAAHGLPEGAFESVRAYFVLMAAVFVLGIPAGPISSTCSATNRLDLLRVADFLRCMRRRRDYLLGAVEIAPVLARIGEELTTHKDTEDEIERCVDEHGNVRADASEELVRLSSRADTLERRARDVARLTLVGDRVVVEQERGGRDVRRECNRQWVRVEVDRERWTREPRLVLRSGRDALRFGETVPASERMALARTIRGMLGAR